MKYLLLMLCLVSLCCAPPRPAVSPAVEASAVTVALVVLRGDEYGPTCAGVWVGDEWILTANHCATDDESSPIERVTFIADAGAHRYEAAVAYRDADHDLALLRARGVPAHAVARVALVSPRPGDLVHVVGHPMGFLWTYLTGQVSGPLRNDPRLPHEGPYLQVQCPIVSGSSGGGAFNDEGELVGVADLKIGQLEGEGLFVPVEVILPFLRASHVL